MTDQEWSTSPDMSAMLAFVAGRNAPPGAVVPRVGMSDRKLRLFLVACCRRQWDLLTNPVYRQAVEVAERFADGNATEDERAVAEAAAEAAAKDAGLTVSDPAEQHAAMMDHFTGHAAWWTCLPIATLVRQHLYYGRAPDYVPLAPHARAIRADTGPQFLANAVREYLTHPLRHRAPEWESAAESELVLQADLIRCVVGNPFRPVTAAPSWLTTNVVGLARGIYADRACDRLLPLILADALEDAGCADEDVLIHCRGPGPHVRGCWVVDLILGRE